MRRVALTTTAFIMAAACCASGVAAAGDSTVSKRTKYRVCDTWDGVWTLRIDDGNGGTSTGQVDIGVFRHERAVGNYTGSTSGILKGDLVDADGNPKACGKHWEGTFKDQSGQYRNKGKFTAHLYKDGGVWRFYGQYKPCRLLCSWNDWSGTFLSED